MNIGENMESTGHIAHADLNRGMANISCFRCEKKFHTSQMMVQHLREEHYSFVNRGVPRSGPDSQPIVVNRNKPDENDSYKNTIAKCPYCSTDCQTRKKLMRHLELEHKDEVDHEEEATDVKMIRLSKPEDLISELSQSSSARVSQSISPTSTTNSQISTPKPQKDTSIKPATKHQYKCFWCDASFRKRGKLMDHIDSLHKQNKQQNQAEADMLSNEDSKTRPTLSSRPSSAMFSGSAASSQTFNKKEISIVQSNNICSFKHSSFVSKPKQMTENVEPPRRAVCTFYLRKTDNPLLQRRPSLPLPDLNEFNKTRVSTSHPDSFMGLPPQVVSPMAAALQHSYMFGLRTPMMMPNNFYPRPRMPMMVPNDYAMGRRPSMIEPGQAQLMARLNALSQQMNTRMPFSTPLSSNSPLDLSKNL